MKKTRKIIISGSAWLSMLLLYQPANAGDIARGEQTFRRCSACHYVDREDNRTGPSLKNIIGRQAGTRAGYRYSPAMTKAGENGLVWSRQTLMDYLHNPQALVRGTRMPPVKIPSNEDIDALIAYMKQAAKD